MAACLYERHNNLTLFILWHGLWLPTLPCCVCCFHCLAPRVGSVALSQCFLAPPLFFLFFCFATVHCACEVQRCFLLSAVACLIALIASSSVLCFGTMPSSSPSIFCMCSDAFCIGHNLGGVRIAHCTRLHSAHGFICTGMPSPLRRKPLSVSGAGNSGQLQATTWIECNLHSRHGFQCSQTAYLLGGSPHHFPVSEIPTCIGIFWVAICGDFFLLTFTILFVGWKITGWATSFFATLTTRIHSHMCPSFKIPNWVRLFHSMLGLRMFCIGFGASLCFFFLHVECGW